MCFIIYWGICQILKVFPLYLSKGNKEIKLVFTEHLLCVWTNLSIFIYYLIVHIWQMRKLRLKIAELTSKGGRQDLIFHLSPHSLPPTAPSAGCPGTREWVPIADLLCLCSITRRKPQGLSHLLSSPKWMFQLVLYSALVPSFACSQGLDHFTCSFVGLLAREAETEPRRTLVWISLFVGSSGEMLQTEMICLR